MGSRLVQNACVSHGLFLSGWSATTLRDGVTTCPQCVRWGTAYYYRTRVSRKSLPRRAKGPSLVILKAPTVMGVVADALENLAREAPFLQSKADIGKVSLNDVTIEVLAGEDSSVCR